MPEATAEIIPLVTSYDQDIVHSEANAGRRSFGVTQVDISSVLRNHTAKLQMEHQAAIAMAEATIRQLRAQNEDRLADLATLAILYDKQAESVRALELVNARAVRERPRLDNHESTQDLQAELKALRAELLRLYSAHADTARRLGKATVKADALLASRSWRITHPLRAFKKMLRSALRAG